MVVDIIADQLGIKPTTSTYKQWRFAMLVAIRNERRLGFTPRGMGRRIMLAYNIRKRRKYFQLLGQICPG